MIELKMLCWNPHGKIMYDPMPIVDFTLIRINGHIIRIWTGLEDKNGTEIYEGSILATSNDGKDGSDIWTQKDWGFGLVTLDIISGLHVKGWASDLQDENSVFALRYVYVVGNIYQDKHLLE